MNKLVYGDLVVVLGGSGLLGHYTVKELARMGMRVLVVSRNASASLSARIPGEVGQIALLDADLTNITELKAALTNAKAVVNLVGIIKESKKQTFDSIHHKLAGNVAKFSAPTAKRLIHISALAVDKSSTSQYARSKLRGETAVKDHFPKATILRPSVMFGREDKFINLFNKLSKLSPIIPLIGGGKTKMQPVYVDDIAKAIANILANDTNEMEGQTLEVAGPIQYTMREIIEFILKVTHRKRLLLNIPFSVAKLEAAILERLPGSILTRDQVELFKVDNTINGAGDLGKIGVDPTPMEPIVQEYLN